MSSMDFEPDYVAEGIWIGKAPTCAQDYALLKRLGVQDVITLQTEDEAASGGLRPEVSFRLALSYGLSQHRVGIPDFSPADLAKKGPEAVALIARLRENGREIYVHCAAGYNRSPTIVAAYLAWKMGISADEACEKVVDAHPSSPDREVVNAILTAMQRLTPPHSKNRKE